MADSTTNLVLRRLWRDRQLAEHDLFAHLPDEPLKPVPFSLESISEAFKMFEGEPGWEGEVRVYCDDVEMDFVFHSRDLDMLGWGDLPNVFICDYDNLDQQIFNQYVARAKQAVSGKRGHLYPTLHHMTQAMVNDIIEEWGNPAGETT